MAINTVINTNMMALTAHRNLGNVGNRQNKANQRLSSGKKINSAADDAAGLAISEKMKAQIRGLDMASKNSEDAISLIQTAEGSLTEVNNMLNRIRELTVQAANDTNQQSDRVKIAEEVATLLTEIDSISNRTEFNEKKLNDGSFKDGHFQIGANGGQKLEIGIGNMSVFGIGADELMEAFGIEKQVDLNPKSSRIGVIDAGEQYKVKTPAITAQNTKAEKSGIVSIEITDEATGKTFNAEFALVNNQGDGFKGDQNTRTQAIVDALNKDERFKEHFVATKGNTGEISIESKEVGGRYKVSKFGYKGFENSDFTASTNADTNSAATNVETHGYDHKINFNNLKDGDTIELGGKTFKKVAAGDVKDTPGGFSSHTELARLLADEGILTAAAANGNAATATDFTIKAVNGQTSGLSGTYSVNAKDVSNKGKDYSNLLENIDESLKQVTTQRAKLGANQNRLEYTIKNLELSSENLNAARSRIEDTDMAKEMMNLTQANVLQQAATSILAQANQAPNNITQLLG